MHKYNGLIVNIMCSEVYISCNIVIQLLLISMSLSFLRTKHVGYKNISFTNKYFLSKQYIPIYDQYEKLPVVLFCVNVDHFTFYLTSLFPLFPLRKTFIVCSSGPKSGPGAASAASSPMLGNIVFI